MIVKKFPKNLKNDQLGDLEIEAGNSITRLSMH